MKKMKKIASLVLAMAMVLSCLAGCGSKSSDAFKIGGIGPLTGPAAVYGIAAMNGAKIAVDEINAAGGINGYQIEWKTADDVHDAEKSVNAYNSLKDWGMQLLCGTVTSTPCAAVAEKAAVDNMFVMTPSASSTAVIDGNENVFQVCFTDPNQGVASAKYIAENFKDAKIGIIYNSSEVYSTGVRESFVSTANELGLNIVADVAFTNESNTDFTTQLNQCKSAGVTLIFYPYYYTEASIMLTEINTMGYDVTFFGIDGMDGILDVEGFDTTLANGVYVLSPYSADSTDALTVNFVTKYKEQFGEVPNQFAADAYDVIYVMKAILEAANATPSMKTSDLCDLLVAEVTKLTFSGITGSGMTWAATGEVSKAPEAFIIQDGKYVK